MITTFPYAYKLIPCQKDALKLAEYREDEPLNTFEVRVFCPERNLSANAYCDLHRYYRMISVGVELDGMVKYSALRELCKGCQKHSSKEY